MAKVEPTAAAAKKGEKKRKDGGSVKMIMVDIDSNPLLVLLSLKLRSKQIMLCHTCLAAQRHVLACSVICFSIILAGVTSIHFRHNRPSF